MADEVWKLALRSVPVTDDDNCSSNGTGDGHSVHGGHGSHGTVLFLFAAFAVGALVRHALKSTPVPYTVLLMVVGLIIGAFSEMEALNFLQDYTKLGALDPHLMLFVFLPTLIFESAFVMDVHTFRKTIGQALVLAGPGLLLCSFLTALIARFIFPYHWSWVASLLFGTLLSATDPVAVVALLKELGASKQLGTIIEGESLLNDGAAIVLFNVLLTELKPGEGQTALEIFTYFVKVAFGGPAFGYLMAKITIFWLSHVFNDALVEITITLASTYITFYIGEGLFQVSGVLAVVTLGIELNSRRTSISPEVEAFLHRFWSMLGYLANTLIFVLVGVVISQRAFSGVEGTDWIFMAVLYFGILVIRLMVIGALMPILTHIGYTVDWKQVTVISWGGLRGAVGLALALVVAQTTEIPMGTIGSKVLFHTAGIVMLTLLVNATTVKYLLKALGMSDISNATRVTMSQAVRRVREAKHRAISMLKSDHFLADANWEMVDRSTEIEDPYKNTVEAVQVSKDGVLVASVRGTQQCPKCECQVPRIPHPKELAELAEEVRMRMIKAERTSYWRQFEQGMLGRDAVLVLIHLADTVMDSPERLITLKDLAPYWKIPSILTKIRQWIKAATHLKSSDEIPRPMSRFLLLLYHLVTHFVFEWTLFGVILVNGVCTATELIIKDETGLQVLESINYVFVAIYIVEAILKMIGLRKHYFFSKWNIFDLLILLVSLVDVIIELSLPQSNSKFSPAVLRLVRIFRILRVGRVLRLLKVVLPLMIRGVDNIVHRRLRFGYDVGKGFVTGEEEMLQQFDRFGALVHEKIAQELRRRAEETKLDVIKSLGQMRKQYPGVALSVKTHQATRSILNHCRDTIKSLLGSGMLDENEAEKLFMSIERKMKHLERTPASLPPPDPTAILFNMPWLSGLDKEVVETIHTYAGFVQLDQGEILEQDSTRRIYAVVSGLVKVTTSTGLQEAPPTSDTHTPCEEEEKPTSPLTALSPGSHSHHDNMAVSFFGAGTIVGELEVLEGSHRSQVVSIECETPVWAFVMDEPSVRHIMQLYPVVEERLWRLSGLRMATQLLPQLPEYQDWPMTKLLLMCEGAYIASAPEEPVPSFEITDEHREVVLVSGTVRCLNTREKLTAPCIIPHNVRYLLMNTGSPKILIIPSSDMDKMADEALEDELNFQPRITSREKLLLFFSSLLQQLYSGCRLVWRLASCCFQCLHRKRVGPADEEGMEEEGRSLGKTPDHDDRAEPEAVNDAWQTEMEVATPLPGESVTTPPSEKECLPAVKLHGHTPQLGSPTRAVTPVTPFQSEKEKETGSTSGQDSP